MIKTHIVTLVPNTLPARFNIKTKVEHDSGEVTIENRADNITVAYMESLIADKEAELDSLNTVKSMMVDALPEQ